MKMTLPFGALVASSIIAFGVVDLADAASTLTGAWTPPTTNTDASPISAPITYNLYQGTQMNPSTPATLTKVQSGITADAVTITTGLTAGTTQCFAVSAVVNGIESTQTPQSCTPIPFPTPNAPGPITITVVTH